MALNVLRGLFVLLMAAVGYSFVVADPAQVGQLQGTNWLALAASLVAASGMIVLDVLAGRRKLAIFSAIAFGILIGLIITYALSLGVALIVNNFIFPGSADNPENEAVISFLTLLIGCVSCYFAISFVLQTKDDFRFIVPYVEFRRDTRGTKPIVVDTSALIDGRLRSVAASGFLDARLVVPQFVVVELQTLADTPEREKRQKGRRGLDVLADLRADRSLDVRIYDTHHDELNHDVEDLIDPSLPVDQRLIDLARQLDAKALTVDVNLAKVAALSGVAVLNLNELSQSLRAAVGPGDLVNLHIDRRGTGEGQGVGRLEDGTMVVVEQAADRVGQRMEVLVTNATQTNAGRMVFAKPQVDGVDEPSPKRRRSSKQKPPLEQPAGSS